MNIFHTFFIFYGLIQTYWVLTFWRIWGFRLWIIAFALCLGAVYLVSYNIGFATVNAFLESVRTFSCIWMALTIATLPLLFAMDGIYLIKRVFAVFTHSPASPYLWGKHYLLYGLIFGFCLFSYALYEAFSPQIITYTLTTNKLPPQAQPVRIAHITDLHISPIINGWYVKRVAELVNRQKPDVFVSTGDLTDVGLTEYEAEATALKNIHAPLGKFAVLGNHEHYRWDIGTLALTKASGFTVLRNTKEQVGGIIFAGIDDPVFSSVSPNTVNDLPLLESLNQDNYIVLLKHRPDVTIKNNTFLFDLQLSGHTHNGQIWPITFITERMYGKNGLRLLEKIKNQTKYLSISNGVGFWGPPMRFLTPAQIIIYNIVPAQK